jgi:hypothetical protein
MGYLSQELGLHTLAFYYNIICHEKTHSINP